MSAVLCLPACLCVSTAASRGQGPCGNASALPPCLGGVGAPSPPWPVFGIPHARGGGWGRGEGGSRRGSPPPSSGGVTCGPRPRPPFVAGASLPGILVRPGPFGSPGAGRGLAARRWVSLARGGGDCRCAAPPQELGRGAPRGRGREGCLAAVCFSALTGQAPRPFTLSVPRPPDCIASRPSAAVLLRPT